MPEHVLAIDQGTTSTRAIVFDARGTIVSVAQREHEQILSARGMGRARPGRDLDQHAVGHRVGAVARASRRRRPRRHRRDEPARDRDRLGPPHGQAGLQRDRLAGHPHPGAHRPPRRRGRHRPLRRGHRPPARDVFLGVEGRVDPRPRPRCACSRRGGRSPLRDARHLGGLEPHRRRPRRHPCHRRHERQPDASHGPADARLVRRPARGMGHPAGDAARDPVVFRGPRRGAAARRRARRSRSRASSAISRRRPSGRRRSATGSRRTPTARATSCSSTPAPRSCARSTD